MPVFIDQKRKTFKTFKRKYTWQNFLKSVYFSSPLWKLQNYWKSCPLSLCLVSTSHSLHHGRLLCYCSLQKSPQFRHSRPFNCHFLCYVMRNGFPKMKHGLLSIQMYFCSCLPLLLLLPYRSYFNATHCLIDPCLEQTFLECIDISKGLKSCYKRRKKRFKRLILAMCTVHEKIGGQCIVQI